MNRRNFIIRGIEGVIVGLMMSLLPGTGFASDSLLTTREYHVSVSGSDKNDGSALAPFKTISAASQVAQPGEVIIVHKGTYRERITPPRGGSSDDARIVYQAAEGEKVEIKGSEIIKEWEKLTGNVWKTTIPNSFFGDYNPYKDLIAGDWFSNRGRVHHTGEVYLNGKSLWESGTIDGVLNPKAQTDKYDPEGSTYTWFCESDELNTYIYANFHNADPVRELVEINVRKSCFYPDTVGINYITVRGFYMSHAATQWAPPTAEQIGLIGTNWSKGWIIENNVISDSKCSGITLGKYGDEWDNKAGWAEAYVGTINRALENDWNKETIGHHIIRNNTIFNCEQTGICGSLGAVFSQITNNHIFNIYTKQQFSGHEMGGIKIHAPIDMLIKNNRIHNTNIGIWLDWMSQGTLVMGNLLYDNGRDLLMEMNHGPFLVANNILLSSYAIDNSSEGGAYVHNLIRGKIVLALPQPRQSPYHSPHSTKVMGVKHISGGDDRFINNVLFDGPGLPVYPKNDFSPRMEGNVLLGKSLLSHHEIEAVTVPDADPQIKLVEKDGRVTLELTWDPSWNGAEKRRLVTGEMLGKAVIPDLPFVNPDGTPVVVDRDYFDTKRDKKMPFPGPFKRLRKGLNILQVWPPEEGRKR